MKEQVINFFLAYYAGSAVEMVVWCAAGLTWLLFVVNLMRYMLGLHMWIFKSEGNLVAGLLGVWPAGVGTAVAYGWWIPAVIFLIWKAVSLGFKVGDAVVRVRERSKQRRDPEYRSELLIKYARHRRQRKAGLRR